MQIFTTHDEIRIEGNVSVALGNFDGIHVLSKIIFIINMLVGRLELIPFLVLLQKDLWTLKD